MFYHNTGNYDKTRNYFNCIYLLVDNENKTYYCGRAKDLNNRLYSHKIYNDNMVIFILEEDCNTINMEYVWLNFFNNCRKKDWKCLNKDYNTGIRFTSKNDVIRHKHIEYSNYYYYCMSGIINDTTGILQTTYDEEVILL